MSKQLVLLFALCALSAIVSSRLIVRPFNVQGFVYCDTCKCGFETNRTTYIPGATVRLECQDPTNFEIKYSVTKKTNAEGKFVFIVPDDHQDQKCSVVLVASPWATCQVADPGRSRSEVILTRNNGAISDTHYANSLGFLRDEALSGCSELVNYLLTAE